jgi:hypothetical protein
MPPQTQVQQQFQQPSAPGGFSDQDSDAGDIIGVIKIKDGIFICDEYGAQVSACFNKIESEISQWSLCLANLS